MGVYLCCIFDSCEFFDFNWFWYFSVEVEYYLYGLYCDISVILMNVDVCLMFVGMGLYLYFQWIQDGVDLMLYFDVVFVYDIDEW